MLTPILKTLSRETAPIALIAMITSVVTADEDIYTDEEKVGRVIKAVKEFDAVYPSEPITIMLSEYDERRKHEKGNL